MDMPYTPSFISLICNAASENNTADIWVSTVTQMAEWLPRPNNTILLKCTDLIFKAAGYTHNYAMSNVRYIYRFTWCLWHRRYVAIAPGRYITYSWHSWKDVDVSCLRYAYLKHNWYAKRNQSGVRINIFFHHHFPKNLIEDRVLYGINRWKKTE